MLNSKLNIIIPASSTTNNIYSVSELIYLLGFLNKVGFDVEVHLVNEKEVEEKTLDFKNKINIILLMWDGPEIIKWLNVYNSYNQGTESIIYGLTASLYGKFIVEDYECISDFIYLNDYISLLRFLGVDEYNSYNNTIKQFPEFDIDILKEIPIIPLVSSIGCINRCTFCAVGCSNSKIDISYSYKSSNQMYNEILEHYKRGRRLFYFVDSCFLTNSKDRREEVMALCKKIYEASINISFYIETRVDTIDIEVFTWLKKAGLKRVLLGVENINTDVLKRYNKNINIEQILVALKILQNLKINIDITMILFDPDSTMQEVLENIEFIINNNLIKYIGLQGVFRRLILIPYHKIMFKNSKLEYCKNDIVPPWLNKSYNYVIPDYESALFENFVSRTMNNVQDNIEKIICDKALGIKEKLKLRENLSNEFLKIYYDVANGINSNTTINEMISNFNKIKEKRLIKYG